MGHRSPLPHCIRPFASGQTVSQLVYGFHQQPRAHQNLRVEDRGVEGVGVLNLVGNFIDLWKLGGRFKLTFDEKSPMILGDDID
jgi:hypothetical protein